MHYIYSAYCATTQKVYVGQTTKPVSKRWAQHCARARFGDVTYLWNAIRKHGESSFEVQQLAEVETNDEANTLERLWILCLLSFDKRFGYNLTSGGDGAFDVSAETRHKMRLGRLGKKASAATREKIRQAKLGLVPHNYRADVPDEQLTALYNAGSSLTEIGKKFSFSLDGVRLRLLSAGVQLRRPGRYRRSL